LIFFELTAVALSATQQLVFRTVGFSGADIRNLVNEAAIMSVGTEFQISVLALNTCHIQ